MSLKFETVKTKTIVPGQAKPVFVDNKVQKNLYIELTATVARQSKCI